MTSNGDAFGSLTALFTGPAMSTATSPIRDQGRGVSLLLTGNLPVMAGLWVTQFADAIARASGPTALVRFDREEVTLELLNAEGRQLPPGGVDAVTRWLPRAATQMRRWVVCLAADTNPSALLASGLPITLITGADEAAVTGAYLRLKHLVDAGLHEGAPLTRMSLAVVGAPPDQAAAAAERLSDAASSFLGLEVDFVGSLQRIERVGSSARSTYPSEECAPFPAFVLELARATDEAALRFDSRPDLAPAPSPRVPEAAPMAGQQPMRSTSPGAGAPASTAIVPLLPGLRPLGIGCPVAPEIELATDDEHRIHIVGRSDQLAKVRIAHSWVTMHRDLLRRAFPALAAGFDVRERILLGDAREAITLHGTGVLLDVLVVAETPGGPVQVVVPLNDPSTCG